MVNTLSFTERKRVRKNFGKLKEVSKFPNLIEIQKKSYEDFLLEHANPSERPDTVSYTHLTLPTTDRV